MWSSLKLIKNVKSSKRFREKYLLRKSIEIWEKQVLFKEDMWIESFYHWRGLLKMEKMYKLKEYKQFFS